MVERWSPESIRAESLVTAFYDRLADQAKKYVPRALYSMPERKKEAKPVEKKSRSNMSRQERARIITQCIHEKMSLMVIAEKCGIKPDRVVLYFEKMLADGVKLDLQYLTSDIENEQKICDAFEQCSANLLKPVFDVLNGEVSYDVLRLVRCVRFGEVFQRPKEPVEEYAPLYF
jgi:hypothetical protein